jgi:hypothetical protein
MVKIRTDKGRYTVQYVTAFGNLVFMYVANDKHSYVPVRTREFSFNSCSQIQATLAELFRGISFFGITRPDFLNCRVQRPIQSHPQNCFEELVALAHAYLHTYFLYVQRPDTVTPAELFRGISCFGTRLLLVGMYKGR